MPPRVRSIPRRIRFGRPAYPPARPGYGAPPPVPQTPDYAAFTQCDFIHPHIDVQAQYALYHLISRGPDRLAAYNILGGVMSGRLQGVFLVSSRAPALLAQSMGRGWWQLIPPGQDAIMVGSPPMIVFRTNLWPDRARIALALAMAWRQRAFSVPGPRASGRYCGMRPQDVPPLCSEKDYFRRLADCDTNACVSACQLSSPADPMACVVERCLPIHQACKARVDAACGQK